MKTTHGIPTKTEYFYLKSDVINKLSELASGGIYVFRGYNVKNQLFPSIIRTEGMFKLPESEFELLYNFEKYGSHYFSVNTPFDFMSVGQHYGLPTRLLDFTYNPYIALRFSLFSEKKHGHQIHDSDDNNYYNICYCKIADHVCLGSLPKHAQFSFGHYETESISKQSIDLLREYESCFYHRNHTDTENYLKGLYECTHSPDVPFSEYKQQIISKIDDQRLCFIDPCQSNQRIIMQQGLFMLPYTLNRNRHMEILEKNISVIKIDKKLRRPLLEYLDTLGYNAFRLMPDLVNVCDTVKQKILDAQSDQQANINNDSNGLGINYETIATKNGHMFKLTASNGETLAVSESYKSISACNQEMLKMQGVIDAPVEDLTEVQSNPIKLPKYEVYVDKSGYYRFRLKLKNGEIIAVSEGYKDKQACLNSIDRLRKSV